MKQKAFTLVELLVIISIIGVLIALGPGVGCGIFIALVLGWIGGLYHLLTGLQHEPVAVLIGLIAFLLLPVTLHFFVAPIAKRHNKIWTFRKSCLTSLMIVLFAGAGLAIISCVHNIVWLLYPKERLFDPPGGSTLYQMQSSSKLKHLATIGIHDYAETHEQQFPSGGTVLENGQLGHGWITQLLPFCEKQAVYEKIDQTKAWNDPQNVPVFKERLKGDFESPYFWRLPPEERIDGNGFFRTDYSANQFVLPVGRLLKRDEITDGLSNTILFGEVTQNLPAWGSPLNGRDPRLGINSSAYGFGSKHGFGSNAGKGVNFSHCDGSVRFYSEATDPKILEALTFPNDGQIETMTHP
ncbi:MAG: DUF1559 domain-containing protein [Planctomycetaceae bacterium]|jgi:hypothetical protein|nr:DUF1559 domain-containing protein [Planctomycetaceae bacterium]